MTTATYGTIWGKAGDEKIKGTTATVPLGTRMAFPDGRVFMYAQAGAAISAGQLLEKASVDAANAKDLAITTTKAIGDKVIRLTVGSAAVNANTFADGHIYVQSSTGAGHLYKLASSHASVASVTDINMPLDDDDPLLVALATTTTAGLFKNTYACVAISSAAAQTGRTKPIVGLAPRAADAGDFFWAQTWGPASVLTQGTIVAGDEVAPGTVAGSISPIGIATTESPSTAQFPPTPRVGFAMDAIACSTEYSYIYLKISP